MQTPPAHRRPATQDSLSVQDDPTRPRTTQVLLVGSQVAKDWQIPEAQLPPSATRGVQTCVVESQMSWLSSQIDEPPPQGWPSAGNVPQVEGAPDGPPKQYRLSAHSSKPSRHG